MALALDLDHRCGMGPERRGYVQGSQPGRGSALRSLTKYRESGSFGSTR